MTNSKMKKRTRTKTQTPALCVLLAVVLASKNYNFAEALSPPSVRSTCTPRTTTSASNKLSNAHHSRSQLQQLHLLGNDDDGASGEEYKKRMSLRRDLWVGHPIYVCTALVHSELCSDTIVFDDFVFGILFCILFPFDFRFIVLQCVKTWIFFLRILLTKEKIHRTRHVEQKK